MGIIKLIAFPLLICLTASNLVQAAKQEGLISVEGNVNQTTKIIIPFEYLISVTVSDEKYQKNLVFSPNRFRLQSIKQSQALPKDNKTPMQELRTPFTNQYIHIFQLGAYFYIFKMPNQFLVFKEQQSSFVLEKQFKLSYITHKNVKFQQLSHELLIIYLSKDEIVLVGPKAYNKTSNPFQTINVVFSRNGSPNEKEYSSLAFFNKSLYVVEASDSIINLKSEISLSGPYKLNQIKIIHVFTSNNSKIIWIVDKQLGLLWVKMSSAYKVQVGPLLLLQQSGCYQLDIKQQKQIKILLTCSSNENSIFIKLLYLYQNHKPILVKQWNPHIQSCKTKRFIFYKEHIFSLEKQSVDIFLPSIYKGDKDLFYIKNWISLEGHSAYWIHRDYSTDQILLYSVDNFRLSKSELILEQYSLQVKSSIDLSARFNLTVEYLCSIQSKVKEICVYETEIDVNIHNKNLSFIKNRSINIAIILLLITSISAVAFICYAKYKTIEQRALQELKALTNPKDYKL